MSIINVPPGYKVHIAFRTIDVYLDEDMENMITYPLTNDKHWFSLHINGEYIGQYTHDPSHTSSLILKNVTRIDGCNIFMVI